MAETNPIKYSDLVAPDNSIINLIAQLEQLLSTYTEVANSIKTNAVKIASSLGNVSGATAEGRENTRKAADEAERLRKAQEALNNAQSETAEELARLKQKQKEINDITRLTAKLNSSAEGSYNRLSAQYSLNKMRLNAMSKEEREAAEKTEQLETKTRELYEEMKRLQEATGMHQLNVGNYPEITQAFTNMHDSAVMAVTGNNQLAASLISLAGSGAGVQGVFTAIGTGVKALGTSMLSLLTNPVFLAIAGIAAGGMAFKWFYDYNVGLSEATRKTQEFTGKSGDDLQAYRNHVQVIADEFDKDFNEVLISANALAQQFGISVDAALQLIQDGFVAGGDANGEMLDTLKEYPAYFKEAGISADSFMAIVAQTAKQGIFSDKGVDAIKEANLRIREMTTATAAALDGIGISSTEVQKALRDGSTTTFEVMKQVSEKLNELPASSSAVGTAIADIFGGPGEDAGLQYLQTLKDIETDLDVVKEQSAELNKLKEEELEADLALTNAMSALFDMSGNGFEQMRTGAIVFIKEGLTNIIQGVIDLVNWFVKLYNGSKVVRIAVQNMIAGIKTGFDLLGNLFTALMDILKGLGNMIGGIFTLDFTQFKEGLVQYTQALPNLVKASAKDAIENAQEAWAKYGEKLEPLTIPTQVEKPTLPGADKKVASGGSKGGAATSGGSKGSAADAAEKLYKRQLAAQRKAEDAALELMDDEWTKKEQKTRYQYERQIEDLRHQYKTQKDITQEERSSLANQMYSLEEQLTRQLTLLQTQRTAAEITAEKEAIELRLKAIEEGTEEEYNLRRELVEKERKLALLKNGGKLSEADINAQYDKQAAAVAEKYGAAQLEIYDKQAALAQSEFDLLKTTEDEKTAYKIKAERERWVKILALIKAGLRSASDVEIKTIENTIQSLDNQLAAVGNSPDHKDIWALMGLTMTDEQKQAVDTAKQYAADALNTMLQAWEESAAAKVDAANNEVSAAQSVLEAEIEARNNGYANNVAAAQKELALAKKTQQKALQQQKEAQQAQEAVQTLQQIGNLVTASSMIWSQLGFPMAIPAIAVMWASFAASKIMAASMAGSSTESYGEGTVELLEGGSHQSGNDIDLGTKADGTRRRAEGGEFFAVINKRNSRRYRRHIPRLINSLNNGTFEQKYLNAYDGTGLLAVNVNEPNTDFRELSENVRKIEEYNRRRVYVDADGNTVTTYKNLTRKMHR